MKTEPLYKRFSTSRFDEYGVLCGIAFNAEENFNFAYDVVDAIAAKEPDKRALVWCDVEGNERTFTFSELSELSSRTANVFKKHGIRICSHYCKSD